MQFLFTWAYKFSFTCNFFYKYQVLMLNLSHFRPVSAHHNSSSATLHQNETNQDTKSTHEDITSTNHEKSSTEKDVTSTNHDQSSTNHGQSSTNHEKSSTEKDAVSTTSVKNDVSHYSNGVTCDVLVNGRKLTPPASERKKMMTNLIKRPPVDIRYENLVIISQFYIKTYNICF